MKDNFLGKQELPSEKSFSVGPESKRANKDDRSIV
jgi:hypothetical protein